MTDTDSLGNIIGDLESLLRYERDQGQVFSNVSPDTLAKLMQALPAALGCEASPAPEPESLVQQPDKQHKIAEPAVHASSATRAAQASPEPVIPVRPVAAERLAAAADTLESLAAEIRACTACPLHATRNHTVSGQGNPNPKLVFIGEGPGADEDRTGKAFVGKAGQLLTRMIAAMGFTRDEVWIGNIVKCRPPGNRTPAPLEMEACMPFLKRQLALLKPKVIVCLGATATQGLLQTATGITRLRGQWMRFENIDVMPTFHPSYLLRDPSKKRDAWNDLQEVMRKLQDKE